MTKSSFEKDDKAQQEDKDEITLFAQTAVDNKTASKTETDSDAMSFVRFRTDAAVLGDNATNALSDRERHKRIECSKGDVMNLILNMKSGQMECYKNDKQIITN